MGHRSGFSDECGIVGICDADDAANLAYLGLYALQHRGQESAGIASLDDTGAIHVEREMGYVADVFDEARLSRLPGKTAIGHVRYSTAGVSVSPRSIDSGPTPTTETRGEPPNRSRAIAASEPAST